MKVNRIEVVAFTSPSPISNNNLKKIIWYMNRNHTLLLITFFTGIIFSISQTNTVEFLEEKKQELEQNTVFERDTSYINILNELAFEIAYSDSNQMKLYATKAKELSKKINYTKGLLEAQNNLADYLMLAGELDQSLAEHEKVIQQAKTNDEKFTALRSLNSKAYIYNQKANYPASFEELNKGLELAEDLNNPLYKLKLNMNLGNLMAYLNETEEALSYYQKCLNTEIDESSSFVKAEVLANMSYTYFMIDDTDSSLDRLFQVIPIFKEKKADDWLAYAYLVMSSNYIKRQELDLAFKYLKKSDSLQKKIEDPRGLSDLNITQAEYYLNKNQLEMAEEKGLLAQKKSKKINYFNGEIASAEILTKIYNEKKNYDQALGYNLLATRLKDSIQIVNNKNKLAILKVKTELDKQKQQEIFTIKEELNQQKAVILITALLLSFLFILLIIVRRNGRKQARIAAELQSMNAVKNKIFAIIGHDLKAPIGTLQELLSLYKQKDITVEEFRNITPQLKANVDYSAFSLNNLFLWAQAQMEGIKTNPENVNVRNSIESINHLYHEQLKQKGILLEFDFPDEVSVYFDREHFNIILRNLIANSIKYSFKNQKITLGCSSNNDKIKITICDTGIGMDDELIANILNGKTRHSRPGTNKEKGTGLGLEICQQLLILNNGELEIESRPDEGSCFYITLPKT